MRKAGRLVAECLDMLVPEIRSGVTTEHIDRLVFEFAMDYGAMPGTLIPGWGLTGGLAAAPHTLVIDDLRNSRECLRARMERNGWVANTAPRTRSDGRASDAVWNAGRASVDGPRAGRLAPAMDSNQIEWVCGLGCAPEGLAGSCLRLSLTSMRRRSAGPLRLGGHLAMGNQIGIR